MIPFEFDKLFSYFEICEGPATNISVINIFKYEKIITVRKNMSAFMRSFRSLKKKKVKNLSK